MRTGKEFAAGGLVERRGKVLLVQMKNLEGRVVWTFPKGHLEKGETWKQAALREVEEETGWKCRGRGRFAEVRYSFERDGRPVDKIVRWYRMEPLEKVGDPDADEIRETKWVDAKTASRRLTYPSDLRLIKRYLKKP